MPNTVKTRSGRVLIVPDDAEDAAINAGIAADPDTFEASSADFAKMKPSRGRPKADKTKESISIRLDADVLDAFRATGEGWQSRINDILKDYVQTHKAA
ncbi:BrnA antitoxin family protein [Paludibacterium purpuratum]|uniref:Uncharacterized protein (DUF4415 family) n=1 Tax=Paludibacterium purpuratum TaxID=1144873 RepID=A0A4R7B5X8_9NEIS|nr:BrnA antitoxin family protein [Paludibacterium purpuratum]TDR80011.1 uncharacterized protein (DUF4415 family) [Paludibacterium purpuratum]